MILSTTITVNWNILPIIIGSMIFIWIITTIVFIHIYKKMLEAYNKKDYERALVLSRVVKYFPKNMYTDYAHLLVSYCYLDQEDFLKFSDGIAKIKSSNMLYIKYYWITFINLYEKETTEIQKNYELFVSNPPNKSMFYNRYSYDDLNERLTIAVNFILEDSIEDKEKLLKSINNCKSSIEKEFYTKIYNVSQNKEVLKEL